ncbi:MAG: hypothetical protein ACK5X3_09950 [Pseudomonadota bacterium]|jgi:hypothetical protein
MKVSTRTQLAAAYGVSRKTLEGWCRRAGIHLPSRILLPPRVLKEIREKLGPWDEGEKP